MKVEEVKGVDKEDVFAGWEEPSEIDFFGTDSPVVKVVEEEKKESEEKEEIAAEKKTEEEGAIENIDFFEEDPEEVEKKEDEEDLVPKTTKTKAPKTEKVSDSISALEHLKEKGIIDYELEEGQELDETKAGELLESSFDERLESEIEDILGDLPDNVKDIVKYAKDGGDVNTLIANMMKTTVPGVTKDTDMTSVSNQEAVMKQEYKDLGYDADFIESSLEALKDSGKLEKMSKSIFEKKIGNQEVLLKQEAEKQKARKLEGVERQREYKAGLSEFLGENKNVKAFKISRKDKTELPSYISDKSIKLESGGVVSPLQKDLYAALQDKEKTLMLAKILKSDFDFSSLEKEAETKVAGKVKRGLQSSDKLTPKESAKSSRKSLAEYF